MFNNSTSTYTVDDFAADEEQVRGRGFHQPRPTPAMTQFRELSGPGPSSCIRACN